MSDARGWLTVVSESMRDARLSLRAFRRERSFTASVVLTLALAIGATTAVFTLVRRAVIEPLPYPQSAQLVSLATRYAGWGVSYGSVSEPEVTDLAAMRDIFERVAPYRLGPVDLAGDGGAQAERLRGLRASAPLLPVLRVVPALGRGFLPEEDLPGGPPVVLLTHAVWRRLGADSSMVGRRLVLNAAPHTVLGVLPPWFDFAEADLVLPLRLDPAEPESRGAHYLRVVGRLAPGVSAERARDALEVVSARLRQDYPDNYQADMRWSLVGRPLRDEVVGSARGTLGMLTGGVVLVLLIACANVANLVMARMQRREREMALRTALGAGRGRLVRQLLIEGMVLSLAGTAAGVVVATLGTNALLALSPGAIPRVDRLGIDPGMLVTSILVAGGSALLFGLAPALTGTREAAGVPRLAGARGASSEGWGTGAGRSFMALLVSVEVALAMLVVVSAGLLVRSYVRLSGVDLGFSPRGVLAFDVTLPASAYQTPAAVSAFYANLLGRLGELPGAERAGGVLNLPLRSGTGSIDIELEGRSAEPGTPSPNFQVVTPGYFEAMRIPLFAGRLPATTDDADAPLVAWVNRAAAERLWRGEAAVGQRFRIAGDTGRAWFTVAGVVGDVRHVAAATEPAWEYYVAHAQVPVVLPGAVEYFHRGLSIVIGSATDPAALTQPARRMLADLDSRVAAAQVETMTAVTARAIGRERLAALLLGAFAVLAGALAAVGIYGVLSYAVSRRTREIGIRMALGARPDTVVGLMAWQGVNAAGIGILVGAAIAFAGSRVLDTLLFGVGSRDPLVFAGSAAGLTAVALAAALIPARRAARVDPMEALRQE